MVVFGFNTDIGHGETVYHVQSEIRPRERLLQTQVFVRGLCLGTRLSPVDAVAGQATPLEQQLQARLRTQHCEVLESIRAGKIESLFAPAAGADLKLEWTSVEARPAEQVMALRFRVVANASPVAEAQVGGRLEVMGHEPAFLRSRSGPDGAFELQIPSDRQTLADATLLVQATHGGRTCRGKFRLRTPSRSCN